MRHGHGTARRRARLWGLGALLILAGPGGIGAQAFRFPTSNRALLEGDGERFLTGTVGKPWTSGGFGCVRTDGRQLHEGLDIRCQQRDARGEPADPVRATAEGVVAYINLRPSLSNYGIYVILRHTVNGIEVYSLYAHLSAVRAGLRAGQSVPAGDVIATLGRTTNTRERISQERAHVHFELNLLLNGRYAAWHRKAKPGDRNDHGDWNGQALVGLDPSALLTAAHRPGGAFDLAGFLRGQTELCRVLVRAQEFEWVRRYPALVRSAPRAAREGIAGYEIALSFNGVPFAIVPRAATEFPGRAKVQLLSVNEAEYRKHPCRRLVVQRSGRWELAPAGADLLDLLLF